MGGPMSKYREQTDSETSGGEKIIPLTIEKAQAWAEVNLDAQDYAAIFGEVEEAGAPNRERAKKSMILSLDVIDFLAERSKKTGTTISETVDYAVRELMKRERRQ